MKKILLTRLQGIHRRLQTYSLLHILVIIACLFYAGYFFFLSVQDHFGLRTQLHDLGHMVQSIWSISQGDLNMTVTHPGSTPHSRLREHANLIFYLIAPLYALWPSPVLLLALATLAPAIGAYVLFRLTRRLTDNESAGALLAFLFLWNPVIHDGILFDFHPIVLSAALLPLTLYWAERGKWRYYWLTVIPLMLLKEDMPLLVFALTPFLFFRHNCRQALVTAGVAGAYWVFLRLGLPHLVGTTVAEYNWHRFGQLGDSPEQVVINSFRHPGQLLEHVASQRKIRYLAQLGLQSGGLALLAPIALLIAVPNLAQNLLLQGNWQANLIGLYYSTAIVVALMCAYVYGYARLYRKFPRLANSALYLYAGIIFLHGLLLTPAPHGALSYWADFGTYYHRPALQDALSRIPETASVATQNNLGPHLANRSRLYSLTHYRRDKPQYIVFHIKNTVYRDQPLFYERRGQQFARVGRRLLSILRDDNYGVIYNQHNFYLLQRNASTDSNRQAIQNAQHDIERYRSTTGPSRPRPWLETVISQFFYG